MLFGELVAVAGEGWMVLAMEKYWHILNETAKPLFQSLNN